MKILRTALLAAAAVAWIAALSPTIPSIDRKGLGGQEVTNADRSIEAEAQVMICDEGPSRAAFARATVRQFANSPAPGESFNASVGDDTGCP
jgi:hypothetical protein